MGASGKDFSLGTVARSIFGTEWAVTIYAKDEYSLLNHIRYHLTLSKEKHYDALRLFSDVKLGDLLFDLFGDLAAPNFIRGEKIILMEKKISH